ncbi:MAG: class I SAM-dependent rRNA methyltransferase [Planctomycetota bacterium]
MTLTGRGRRWVLGGHPWVFADDVADGEGEPGELLPVYDPNEHLLGWGLFSSSSKIAVRFVTRGEAQPNRAFWQARIAGAIERRVRLGLLAPDGACRLLSGDAEGVPGLVVDRYRDVLVIQVGTQGAERMRDFLVELVREALPFDVRAVLDRSDLSVRRLEGLEERVEWLHGRVDGPLEIVEEPGLFEDSDVPRLVYGVSLEEGHKTGHYLDQRTNRQRAAVFAQGEDVLDAFSYDGLFGIRAALAGAKSVVCLDQSAACEVRVLANAERNGVADRVRFERGNAMHDLKRRETEGERYGLVVVDPPAFARNKKELEGAQRGYRELNRRALSLTTPGGTVVTASCSHAMKRAEFESILGQASLQVERAAWFLATTGAAPDHPVRAGLPETDYLKCAFLSVE